MATTKLNTKALKFSVTDMQGKGGFPMGDEGFVYEYREQRVIKCRVTRLDIHRDVRYRIRTDDTGRGFRIDLLPKFGPAEAVYGLAEGRPTYWDSAEQAAAALVDVLDEIATNSTY